jgi:hypothetical protein
VVVEGQDVRRVKVKGSSGEATTVELTTGEVENSRESIPADLYVVDGIQWTRAADGSVHASGGHKALVERLDFGGRQPYCDAISLLSPARWQDSGTRLGNRRLSVGSEDGGTYPSHALPAALPRPRLSASTRSIAGVVWTPVVSSVINIARSPQMVTAPSRHAKPISVCPTESTDTR